MLLKVEQWSASENSGAYISPKILELRNPWFRNQNAGPTLRT